MDRGTLLERIDAVELEGHALVIAGLLESTQLKERRDWLAALDLLTFEMDALRYEAQSLLGKLPEDSVRTLAGWVEALGPKMEKSLKESVFDVKSKRVQRLVMVDQWVFVQKLVERCIESVYLVREREAHREKILERKRQREATAGGAG